MTSLAHSCLRTKASTGSNGHCQVHCQT